MRLLPTFLALVLAVTPVIQVFAGTMAESHCHMHGHVDASAALARGGSHDMHHPGSHLMHGGSQVAGHDQGGVHCKCGCMCGLACIVGVALTADPASTVALLVHEHWQISPGAGRAIAIPRFLLRPPSFS